MNKYFGMTIKAALAALFCFSTGIASAAATLVVSDVDFDPLGLATPYISQGDTMYIAVTLIDPTASDDINLDPTFGGSAFNPELTFWLYDKGNTTYKIKTATFLALGSSFEAMPGYVPGTFMDTLYFTYTPSATDYALGAAIPSGLLAFSRTALSIPVGGSINDLNGFGTLPPSSSGLAQYSAATADAIKLASQTVEINMYKLESPQSAGVILDSGASVQVVVKRATGAESNTVQLNLGAQSANTARATVSPATGVILNGESSYLFTITGVTPGTTSVTVYCQDHVTELVTIPVTVNLSGSASQVTVTPNPLIADEDASGTLHMVRVNLASASAVPVTFNVSGYTTGVTGPASFSIPANQTEGVFYIQTLDGASAPVLTIQDAALNYTTTYLSVSVVNLPPTIWTPVDGKVFTSVIGETLTIDATATDPAKTYDTLTYTWDFGDGTGTSGVNLTHVTKVYNAEGDYTISLTVSDEDGGSTTLLYTVTVEVGHLLVLEVPTAYAGLQGLGTGYFRYLNPPVTWYPLGNRFGANYEQDGVYVEAIPTNRSYRFTWVSDQGISDAQRRMPAWSDAELRAVITVPEALHVYYLFSREYYTPLADYYGIDGFGDIDNDGLGDRWESYWRDPFDAISTQIGQISSTDPQGVNGAFGNADGDWLPMAGIVTIPNVMTNGRVRVYQYPIANYLPNVNNPFTSLIEFRGLEEDQARAGETDVWRRYAMELPVVGSPNRGNDAATDPTLIDSDEDGLTDGWEYYFWTTIMYEVANTNDWRAFDPSFNMYRTNGLPLLIRGVGAQPQATIPLANRVSQSGTVTAPVAPGTFTVTFDDGTVYTDDGKGRLILANVSLFDPVLAETYVVPSATVLTIDYGSGDWTVIPPIGATVGADFTIDYSLLDGIYTKDQLLTFFDPMVGGSSNFDIDQDGLSALEEFALGTNPIHWDTDGDGMPDGWEVERGLDPLNAADAIQNPDQDLMTPGHVWDYLDARTQQTYWNGEAAFGFNPTVAWEGAPIPPVQFTNLEEFRVAEYYIFELSRTPPPGTGFLVPPNTVDSANWLYWTTNPLDNDTDVDGMPDGWELYVGMPAAPRPNVPLFDVMISPPIGDGTDFDDDGLTAPQEFSGTAAAAVRAANVLIGTNGVMRAFPVASSDWTNKAWATDPWNADTDGDSLGDGLEHAESPLFDANADGLTLVNLNPCSVDTDWDWLPDGWEYYNGLQTIANAVGDFANTTGTYGDPDGDGLPNYQEYLAGCNYGWRYDKLYSPANTNLWKPAWVQVTGSAGTPEAIDPNDIFFRPYDAGDFLLPYPSPYSMQQNLELMEHLEATFGIAVNPAADGVYGYTYLELLQRVIMVIQDPAFPPDPASYFAMLDFQQQLHAVDFNCGLAPLGWDPHAESIPLIMPYYFIAPQTPGIYATCNPRNPDSDYDGMQDYWEAYHGLSPLYGGDISGGAEDRMGNSISFNLAVSGVDVDDEVFYPFFGPYARQGKEEYRKAQIFSKWRPYDSNPLHSHYVREPYAIGGTPTEKYFNTYYNTWRPYDLVNNPALSGCPYGDPDEDGLNSREESWEAFGADILSHTDPSPYWITDFSYYNVDAMGRPTGAASHVNNYYAPGTLGAIWWWPYGLLIPQPLAAPSYLFDYETNEGFDTDNDNISDRKELVGMDGQGVSDPLDFDSPRSRKAMYFDGNAACRTRNPYFHDKWSLTSYTVELWFRAEHPVGHGVQTLIERPVLMPVDWKNVDSGWAIRRNFRLSITNDGRLRGEFQNDALATVSLETSGMTGTISPNIWYHVALAMDSQNNTFTIYLNGAQAESIGVDIKPCNGYFPLAQFVNYTNIVETLDVRQYFPAPIVVGVSDMNTTAVVDGQNDPVLNPATFFEGWIDEIRVWDRVRTQGQIQSDLYKRYDRKDVAAVNDARYVWEVENIVTLTNGVLVTPLGDFPQKLLYHFSFDSLPDVGVPDPDRLEVRASETDEVPFGYDGLSVRPPVTDYPGIPWWYNSSVRSTVYNRDYTYVPIIENTAAHLRQFPPLDISSLFASVVDPVTYNAIAYRWRTPQDWLIETDPMQPQNPGTSFDVDAKLIPNSANPYGVTYQTALSGAYEINPLTFSGEIGEVTRYETLPIYTDMLPLLNAVADIDVEMWDGKGEGYDPSAVDSDGDDLPDWWEIANGLDPNDPDGDNGSYGDPDADGLDNYAEYMAGTSPGKSDTDGDGYSDYYSRDNGRSLTYGELYDDMDGMPNAWEIVNGLSPNRYDADDDLDNDGWTNYEEYMDYAGGGIARPNAGQLYPTPDLDFTINYDGTNNAAPSLIVYTYSEKTGGSQMGGGYDGRLSNHNTFRDYGTITYNALQGEVNSYLTWGGVLPNTATITVTMPNGTVLVPVAAAPFNEATGVFQADPIRGDLMLDYASGRIFGFGAGGMQYDGATYMIDYHHRWNFPAKMETITGAIVDPVTHIRSGFNRFFGFFDLNGSGEFDIGEPCGLSVNRPTLVSWGPVQSTIAVTDALVGYPRFAWPVSTGLSTYYTVTLKYGTTVAATIKVDKPRNYFHEGDLINSGLNGLPFGAATSLGFTYSVADGTTVVATGSFSYDLGTAATRRKMLARGPEQLEKVYGSVVEFEWEMDYRSQGATIMIRGIDDGITYYNGTIPLPMRHGKVTDTVYYYTASPQLVDGKSFFSLPPGRYTYTITEVVNTSAFAKQSVTERFQIVTDEEEGRNLYSISGNVSYFGKAEMTETTSALHTFDGIETGYSGVLATTNNLIPGTISIQVVTNGAPGSVTVIESLNDSRGDGALLSESGSAASARIYYDTGEYSVDFSGPMPAGSTLRICYKRFLKPLVIEAFKLADSAVDCYTVSGSPVARNVVYAKGLYKLEGLPAGKYTVRAFLDSNNNRLLDPWESYGIAANGASQGPVAYTLYDPIILPTSRVFMDITICDRDTDNDLLPDAWEYQHYGSLPAKSGYDQSEPDLYIYEEYADGPLDSDPNRIDTDEDGLSDGVELRLTGTDTHIVDSDYDGVSDLEEFLSGSNPKVYSDAVSFKTLGVEFDAQGNPFIVCPYPALVRGIVVSYILKSKENLADPVWTPVCEATVQAEDVANGTLPAGTMIMKPKSDLVKDWNNGFFKVDVQVDYGTWTLTPLLN